MRLVRKTVLKEAEANPLETIDVDLSYDEQYKQADGWRDFASKIT